MINGFVREYTNAYESELKTNLQGRLVLRPTQTPSKRKRLTHGRDGLNCYPYRDFLFFFPMIILESTIFLVEKRFLLTSYPRVLNEGHFPRSLSSFV